MPATTEEIKQIKENKADEKTISQVIKTVTRAG